MDIGVKEVVLVLLGFVLAHIPNWFDRRRKLKSHWSAIRSEVLICMESANNLINDGVMSPLYRLPMVAFEKSFPILLAEGEASESELLVLSRFFAKVQEINRGLDLSATLHEADALKKQHGRNLLKAEALVKGPDSAGGLAQDAINIANIKLERLPVTQ